jgi:hypothetical protein
MKKVKILLGLVVVVGIFLIGINFKSKYNYIGNVSSTIISQGIISGYSEEEIKEILQQQADESCFSFEINACPVFENGSSEGNLRIANPPYNNYGLSVEITLDEDNVTVFKTDMIEPNHYIEYAKLSKKLEAGEYSATATINAHDLDTQQMIGASAAKITIYVKE